MTPIFDFRTNPYTTHQPVLAHYLQKVKKPILELGCGYGSTPLLHDYAEKHNPQLTRRGKKMTFSYLYRIIRDNERGHNVKGGEPRELWFKYEYEGEKDRIWIIL